jgi:type I restriction enzyme R subunit
LKDKVEKRLKQMVEQNPLRVDFYKRYQEIIDEYNSGKDAVTIDETFKKLIEFVNSLSAEEADTKREGLTEEQKAIFDILRKPDISESEKKKIKEIAIELLEELKKDKLKVVQWADKSVTAAAVFNVVSKTLFEELPYPTYKTHDIDLKTHLVYEHLKHQYYGGGMSIYGHY